MHQAVNIGDCDLYAVTVESGQHKFGHGYLIPSATAGYHGSMPISRSPAPIVSWRTTPDGEAIRRKVELERNPGSRDIVVFEIDGEDVNVRYKRR